ncbi:M24 family metallopeptidase [Lolliginicoccus suaedae]|uniref:M24 family metallopeptidase n=1 Tax=Lolliginicoccus suaedae TaxID=2605429 RepID=UPI0011EFDF43|nr:Xaa-Pro peptidase family protein [Lolliginicoccus suaedae]
MAAPDTGAPSATYAARLDAAARLLGQRGIDALLITPGPDLQYLTGSTMSSFERLTCLVVPASGQPRMIVPRLEVAALRGTAFDDLGIVIVPWVDGEDPHGTIIDVIGADARAAIADATPALHVIPLQARLGQPLALATEVLREMRMIKDEAEKTALREAGAAIDRVHARMGEFLRAGRTEAEVAAMITDAIVEEGHTGAAFVIVGSGPHGADPHHEVSDRVIARGDIVVIDIGGPVPAGYFSDCTRTYSIGEPDPAAADRIAILEEAQARAVATARPGATSGQVDAAARDHLAAHSLGEYFVHRTGHGIGLSVHEEPYIMTGGDQVLAEGMAFSIEPGIYLPGEWGARIEDIVILTADGCEPVNRQPHGLTVLPG